MKAGKYKWLLALGVIWALSPHASAQLSCKEPTHDRGIVRAGTPLKHTFVLQNLGEQTIQVLEARPGCGCLKPPIANATLQPKQIMQLPVEIHTLTQPEGPHAFPLTVKYLLGSQVEELKLSVQAQIQVEVQVTPAAAAIFTDRAQTHTFTIRDSRTTPLKIISAESSIKELTITVGSLSQDESGASLQQILVQIPESLKAGRYQAWISLTSNDPAYSDMKIPMTIVKREKGLVQAAPAKLFLEGSISTPLPSRIIRLSSQGAGNVRIENVETNHPAVRCTWAHGPGEDATLRLLLDEKKLPVGQTTAEVQVKIRDVAQPLLMIPVSINLR